MNAIEFSYLINKPDAVNNQQILSLEKIIENFPYFQSARSIHLKGLYKQDSFKYNHYLKTVAAYTTDRSVLFDFITSENFIAIQKQLVEEKESKIFDIDVADSVVVYKEKTFEVINPLEKSIISSINAANFEISIEKDIIFEKKEDIKIAALQNDLETNLEIGKPLQFNQFETHSFQEWLQIAKFNPIIREEESEKNDFESNNLSSKLEIIDKFIEANPKIPQVGKDEKNFESPIKSEDNSYLMTETLAKVYLEQKKYSKAIQAYEILILKYPEKSSFFANRISDIKMIQQNFNN